jgi:hypothetical protein
MTENLINRISFYLASGGLFNPELADHIAVRTLLFECREALAQPEQEPVATLDDLEQEIYENTRQFVSCDVMEWMLKRYYTTPPQRTWVGLTWSDVPDQWLGNVAFMEGGKWAEKTLKEKNT